MNDIKIDLWSKDFTKIGESEDSFLNDDDDSLDIDSFRRKLGYSTFNDYRNNPEELEDSLINYGDLNINSNDEERDDIDIPDSIDKFALEQVSLDEPETKNGLSVLSTGFVKELAEEISQDNQGFSDSLKEVIQNPNSLTIENFFNDFLKDPLTGAIKSYGEYLVEPLKESFKKEVNLNLDLGILDDIYRFVEERPILIPIGIAGLGAYIGQSINEQEFKLDLGFLELEIGDGGEYSVELEFKFDF